MIERDEFVEWAEVHGNFYGSPQAGGRPGVRHEAASRSSTSTCRAGQSIKRKYPEAVLVFVLPPQHGRAGAAAPRAGDRDRGRDPPPDARRPLRDGARGRERTTTWWSTTIVERAYAELESIVSAERCRRGRVDLAAARLSRHRSEAVDTARSKFLSSAPLAAVGRGTVGSTSGGWDEGVAQSRVDRVWVQRYEPRPLGRTTSGSAVGRVLSDGLGEQLMEAGTGP